MKCPDCKRVLKPKAIGCTCGWSIAGVNKNNAPLISCQNGECLGNAVCRVGETNLCLTCYDKLPTTEYWRLKNYAPQHQEPARSQVPVERQREPGED